MSRHNEEREGRRTPVNWTGIGRSAIHEKRRHRTAGACWVVLAVLVLMALGAACTKGELSTESDPSISQAPSVIPTPTPSPTPEPVSIRLAAVGDVLIHSSLWKDAKTENGYDFTPMFERVKPIIESADFAIANQETMIGGTEIGLSDYPTFNGPKEVGDALKDAGFDAVTMANNHTLDRGVEAIRRSLEHWEQLGVVTAGAYLSEEERNRITLVDVKGVTFAIVAYTYGTNGIPFPAGMTYLTPLLEEEALVRDLKAAREQADVVIAALHFGVEYVRMPDESQKEWARLAIASGADIVLGHHPHVLQPPEWVEAGGRRGFVAYSLGNFISGQDQIYREIGAILLLDLKVTPGDASGKDAKVEIHNPEMVLTWTHKRKWRDYKLFLLGEVTEEQLAGAGKYYEEMKQHLVQFMPELVVR